LTVDLVAVGADDRVIDVACGTGDLLEIAEQRGARTLGIDFAGGMLTAGRQRAPERSFAQGDGASLPVRDASFDVVTCGFALRNFVSVPDVLAEFRRVLDHGGRVAVIDVDRPVAGLLRWLHSLYFDGVVPRIGAVLSDRAAYQYLPRSTAYLPDEPVLRGWFEAAGFTSIERRSRLFGSAQIWTAVRK
jgi:demethylmenaquinone methyltransferase/2-methoxy-6-polyprenyl-1,4-benzoquinol methylase